MDVHMESSSSEQLLSLEQSPLNKDCGDIHCSHNSSHATGIHFNIVFSVLKTSLVYRTREKNVSPFYMQTPPRRPPKV